MALNNASQGSFMQFLGSPGGAAAFGGVSSLFSGLAGLIGGAGQRRRRRGIFDELGGFSSQFSGLQGRLNPQDLLAKSVVGMRPELERLGRQFDERFGFDTGKSAGFLSELFADKFAGLLPGLEQQSAFFDLEAINRARLTKGQQGGFA